MPGPRSKVTILSRLALYDLGPGIRRDERNEWISLGANLASPPLPPALTFHPHQGEPESPAERSHFRDDPLNLIRMMPAEGWERRWVGGLFA